MGFLFSLQPYDTVRITDVKGTLSSDDIPPPSSEAGLYFTNEGEEMVHRMLIFRNLA